MKLLFQLKLLTVAWYSRTRLSACPVARSLPSRSKYRHLKKHQVLCLCMNKNPWVVLPTQLHFPRLCFRLRSAINSTWATKGWISLVMLVAVTGKIYRRLSGTFQAIGFGRWNGTKIWFKSSFCMVFAACRNIIKLPIIPHTPIKLLTLRCLYASQTEFRFSNASSDKSTFSILYRSHSYSNSQMDTKPQVAKISFPLQAIH